MLLFLIIFVPALFTVFLIWTNKYKNIYSLTFVFGKKGSGKSTYLCKKAIKFMKKGWYVYTNMDDIVFPGIRHIDIDDLDVKHLPPAKTLIILDEVGMVWDARKFKSFRDEVRDFFKLQRHARCRVIVASQTFDIDKKIRDLTDDMILCTKFFNVFSMARHISKVFVLTAAQGDSESRIAENLAFSRRFILFPHIELTYIPKYAAFFDSFSLPDAEALEYSEDSIEDLSPVAAKKYKRIMHTR